jgi:hypothetical protein
MRSPGCIEGLQAGGVDEELAAEPPAPFRRRAAGLDPDPFATIEVHPRLEDKAEDLTVIHHQITRLH